MPYHSADQRHDTRGNKTDHIAQKLADATGNDIDPSSVEEPCTQDNAHSPPNVEALQRRSLAERLQIIFNLPSPEALCGEWSCYIVRSAIVPGFLYLTENHICFYASLPNSQQRYRKTGYLLIKQGGNYQRCYFDLDNDALPWYESATDLYSPLGKIDLKDVLAVRQSRKRTHGLKITTTNKTWHLQADTRAGLIEWLNVLQKAIFRAKHHGANLKVSLPFENILDIEQTDAFEFQQFLKIRAVGIDDPFVMDEYYFAYFTDIKSTFEALWSAWNNAQIGAAHHLSLNGLSLESPKLSNNASPLQSPSLSISDLYDINAQPITIPAVGESPKPPSLSTRQSSMSSVVANALSVPSAIRELLYPSTSTALKEKTPSLDNSPCNTTDPNTADVADSSSSEEDDQAMRGWLAGKKKSGMKLVYGLLGAHIGSPAVEYPAHHLNDEENDDEDDKMYDMAQETLSSSAHGIPIDDRTRANFRKYFVLPESERLHAVYPCSLMKTLPCYGKLYISSNHVSFNSKGFATNAKMIIPLQEVVRIQKLKHRGYLFHSLSIVTQNKREVFLEFSSLSKRNSCFARLFLQHKWVIENRSVPEQQVEQDARDWEARLLAEHKESLEHIIPPTNAGLPVLNRPTDEPLVYQQPGKPLHFTCVTIGTRGDVQPYIALCKGLMKEGHTCRIATHDEFEGWIREHGIEFRSIGGDPSELMRICVENSFFSVNFVKEGLKLFKVWIDELLKKTWEACQDTDVLIESPSAMVGVHMAEKLQIPYFRSFPMPMTRTRSFPHPFATPNRPKGRLYNDMTYVLFDHAIWQAIATRTNTFRQEVLGLARTSYDKLEVWKIPYLYSFSPHIVPSPLDWMDWIHCTGYWFLDSPQTGWEPSVALREFVEAKDTRPIVYIGFGSIIVSDPQEMTRIIVESILLSNVRAIVSEGWSSRLQDKGASSGSVNPITQLLEQHRGTILSVPSVPHDWLFPRVRAVLHHGGAGTTAAGLRAGRPTVIKPFFADQFFWGERVQDMGVGLCIKTLTIKHLSAALRIISTDQTMLKTAEKVGQKIRSERGVETAIQCLYRDMELAMERTRSSAQRTIANTADEIDDAVTSFLDEDQGWTVIDPISPGAMSPRT
ncbi:uncharacterized protein BYT42DRAFT_500835 [Radiomyces spectabilis]|uniref:uncharacterized protein n=1 Tax=Radiomyces spectabilis TaxID=64574 RepID=UPI00221F832F|nr:uncharacterized protein BYT42DRAFT_500835 [Radiomyces spectabilis]KAI8373124.1 hypothetical protein BYT42DRAFT_500835 [Radiomyces spectabilis]